MEKSPTKEEIRLVRESMGLTQEKCAEMAGLGAFSRWAEYESGRRNMPAVRWEIFLLRAKHTQAGTVACASCGEPVPVMAADVGIDHICDDCSSLGVLMQERQRCLEICRAVADEYGIGPGAAAAKECAERIERGEV